LHRGNRGAYGPQAELHTPATRPRPVCPVEHQRPEPFHHRPRRGTVQTDLVQD